ncbi:UNVERIFIED_CONTAM: hypothetical protein RMT77_001832 [Armadillidium vulgare]
MTMATAEAGEGSSPPNEPAANNRNRGHHHLQQEYPHPATTTAATPSSSTAIATAHANARADAVNAVSELPMAHNSYDELSVIGNGAYGTVYLGRDKSNEGRLVALKKIRITLTEDGVPVNALREIALLKQLEKFEHPNIVRLLDICHGRIERENRLTLILVFEYVEQDLDNFLKKCPAPSLEPLTIKSLMHQVLCGVDFLHQHRIIHRDLKPQNLLVDRFHRVKIADFGLARIYDFHMRLTTMVVTLWYRAPEVLLCNSYATPVDLWSCGCIFAELFRRKPLFEGQTEGDQLQRIFDVIGKPTESEWPKDVSLTLTNFRDHAGTPLEDVIPEITPDAKDLLRKLLKFVPEERICASEALKHPYFRGMNTPRISASSNRSTPTQHVLTTNPLNRSLSNATTSASTVSPPTLAPSSVIFTSSSTSQDNSNLLFSSSSSNVNTNISSSSGISSLSSSCRSSTDSFNNNNNNSKESSTNDENNPNAGNSAGFNVNNDNISNNNNNRNVNNNNNNPESDPKVTERSESTSSTQGINPQIGLVVRTSARKSPNSGVP